MYVRNVALLVVLLLVLCLLQTSLSVELTPGWSPIGLAKNVSDVQPRPAPALVLDKASLASLDECVFVPDHKDAHCSALRLDEKNIVAVTAAVSCVRLCTHTELRDDGGICRGWFEIFPAAGASALYFEQQRGFENAGASHHNTSLKPISLTTAVENDIRFKEGPNDYAVRLVGPEVDRLSANYFRGLGKNNLANASVAINSTERYAYPFRLSFGGTYVVEMEWMTADYQGLDEVNFDPTEDRVTLKKLRLLPRSTRRADKHPTAAEKIVGKYMMETTALTLSCSVNSQTGRGSIPVPTQSSIDIPLTTDTQMQRHFVPRLPYCDGTEFNTQGHWVQLDSALTVSTPILDYDGKSRQSWPSLIDSEYEWVPEACRLLPHSFFARDYIRNRTEMKSDASLGLRTSLSHSQLASSSRLSSALRGKIITIIGDSHARSLFFSLLNVLNGYAATCLANITFLHHQRYLPVECIEPNVRLIIEMARKRGKFKRRKSHVDFSYKTNDGKIQLLFVWNPWLNPSTHQTAMLATCDVCILGFGQWTIAHANGKSWSQKDWETKLIEIKDRMQQIAAATKAIFIFMGIPAASRRPKPLSHERRVDRRIRRFNDVMHHVVSLGHATTDSTPLQLETNNTYQKTAVLRFVDTYRLTEAWSHTTFDGSHYMNFVEAQIVRQLITVVCSAMNIEC